MSVFDDIYRRNAWNGIESRSGPGSGTAATAPVAAEIVRLVDELGVRSVLDVGCGDGYWMPELPGYRGIDTSPEAIRLARERHPTRHYATADITWPDVWKILAPHDLVILRDAMQHLPLADGVTALETIRGTGSRYLLASTFRDGENRDITEGDAYAPDLEAPPFDLGPPERLIFDGYGYRGRSVVRDPRKHLGLWLLTTG